MAVQEYNDRLCKEIVMEEVVHKAWLELEVQHIMEMMYRGDITMRVKVEHRLREERELLEAEEAQMRQAQKDRARLNKMKALKILWKKKRLEKDIMRMTDAMEKLEMDDWDKELGQLMDMLEKLIVEEGDSNSEERNDEMDVTNPEFGMMNDEEQMNNEYEVEQSECTLYSPGYNTDILMCTQEQVLTVDCTLEVESPPNSSFRQKCPPETPQNKPNICVTDMEVSVHKLGAIHVSNKIRYGTPPRQPHQRYQEYLKP